VFWLLFVPTPAGCFPFPFLASFSALFLLSYSLLRLFPLFFFLPFLCFFPLLLVFSLLSLLLLAFFLSFFFNISKAAQLVINEPKVALLFDQWELTLEEGSGTLRVPTLMESFLCCYSACQHNHPNFLKIVTFEALTRSKKYLLRCDRPILAHNLVYLYYYAH
jgi:hypothetical protein